MIPPAPDPPVEAGLAHGDDGGGIRFVGSYESPVRQSTVLSPLPSEALSPGERASRDAHLPVLDGDEASVPSPQVAPSGSGSPTGTERSGPDLLLPSHDGMSSGPHHAPPPDSSSDPPPPPSISISSSPSIEFSSRAAPPPPPPPPGGGVAPRRPSLSSSVGSASSSTTSGSGKRGRFNPIPHKSAPSADAKSKRSDQDTRGAEDVESAALRPGRGSPSSSRFFLKAKRSRSGGSDQPELNPSTDRSVSDPAEGSSWRPSSSSRRSSSSTTTSGGSSNHHSRAPAPTTRSPPQPPSTTGEGRLARGLRKTRSGLKLFAAARAAREDEPASVPVEVPVAGSPAELRTSDAVPSRTGYTGRSSSTLSLPLPEGESAASPPLDFTPRPDALPATVPQSPPVGTRVGGWFNSLRPNTPAAGPASPPERSCEVAAGSPSRCGSPLKKNSVSASSAAAASSTMPVGRLGPFDRMLDRAVQYFLDADANADRCEDDIWLLGVRHPGWSADALDKDAADDPGAKRGGIAGLVAVARRTSPVKARPAVTPVGDDPFVVPSGSSPVADEAPATRINGWPAAFYRDFYSRVGLTYRSDFPVIECDPPASGGVVQGMLSNLGVSIGRGAQRVAPAEGGEAAVRGLSSDTGWGCMLRTGQSLLANALVKVHLGRDWRRPLPGSSASLTNAATYARILSLFLDDPSPLSPFSVHRFAQQGKQLGKQVGEWFGPSTAAGAIKSLVNAYDPAGLRVVSCVDGTVYESEVVEASTVDGAAWSRPVLVLVNVRLGLEGVNPVYYDAIRSVFRFPQSVGIAGGRPMSSYYFVGAQADSLFYIDPHFPRPAVPLVLPTDPELVEAFARVPVGSSSPPAGPPSAAPPIVDRFLLDVYPDSVWATYHCDKVRKVALSSLDPSMFIGFVVENASDWVDFGARVQQLSSAPMFAVAPSPPAWLRRSASSTNAVPQTRNSLDGSFSVISEAQDNGFSEPEDWELQSTDDEGSPPGTPHSPTVGPCPEAV
ncbi:hypothetical protein JCM3774_001999 [Rhodotorula dairenensis]